jgi:hypothetical protein
MEACSCHINPPCDYCLECRECVVCGNIKHETEMEYLDELDEYHCIFQCKELVFIGEEIKC